MSTPACPSQSSSRPDRERRIAARRIEATLTECDVLAQTAGRIVACGIDRWLGGVHLQGRGHVWRWDDERGRVMQL